MAYKVTNQEIMNKNVVIETNIFYQRPSDFIIERPLLYAL